MTAINLPTSAERCARGAALLDLRMPGWAARIDTESLDINSPSRCVLGQLGGFGKQRDALGLGSTARIDPSDGPGVLRERLLNGCYGHGFSVSIPSSALEPHWIKLIEARRTQSPVSWPGRALALALTILTLGAFA